nr:hypothetical protein [Paratractidigestivibacter sp.]
MERFAREPLDADLTFEIVDRSGDRLHGNALALGRQGEARVLEHKDEILDPIDVHSRPKLPLAGTSPTFMYKKHRQREVEDGIFATVNREPLAYR